MKTGNDTMTSHKHYGHNMVKLQPNPLLAPAAYRQWIPYHSLEIVHNPRQNAVSPMLFLYAIVLYMMSNARQSQNKSYMF